MTYTQAAHVNYTLKHINWHATYEWKRQTLNVFSSLNTQLHTDIHTRRPTFFSNPLDVLSIIYHGLIWAGSLWVRETMCILDNTGHMLEGTVSVNVNEKASVTNENIHYLQWPQKDLRLHKDFSERASESEIEMLFSLRVVILSFFFLLIESRGFIWTRLANVRHQLKVSSIMQQVAKNGAHSMWGAHRSVPDPNQIRGHVWSTSLLLRLNLANYVQPLRRRLANPSQALRVPLGVWPTPPHHPRQDQLMYSPLSTHPLQILNLASNK